VRVDGVDVVEDPDSVRAKIGYLPETPPLYPEMTVREYLRFAGKIRGLTGAQLGQRVDEAIRLTELGAVRADAIGTLSHGFRQRVGIAQAIVHRPALVVLDEPISGLDPVQIVEMREMVRSLRGEHTVVVSSHILSEISETCDRILVIGDGKIIASGTEAELSTQWLSGIRVALTVRRPANNGLDQLEKLICSIEAVVSVQRCEPREKGADLATFEVQMNSDAREAIVAQLVANRVGILEVSRSHRELESVFLQLSGGSVAKSSQPLGADMPKEETL
jgi:ABC-2 type transport system ATP-binding protein